MCTDFLTKSSRRGAWYSFTKLGVISSRWYRWQAAGITISLCTEELADARLLIKGDETKSET